MRRFDHWMLRPRKDDIVGRCLSADCVIAVAVPHTQTVPVMRDIMLMVKQLERKKSVSKQDYADFVVEYKQRRTDAVKEKLAKSEKVEQELEMLSRVRAQPEEKIEIEVLETLSEEEEVDDNTDLFEDIFGPMLKTIEEAKVVVKSIKKAQEKSHKIRQETIQKPQEKSWVEVFRH